MKTRSELKHPSSFEAEASALNQIASALLDNDGPGDITEAVYLCAGNLADIAKTLANIEKVLKTISINVLPGE